MPPPLISFCFCFSFCLVNVQFSCCGTFGLRGTCQALCTLLFNYSAPEMSLLVKTDSECDFEPTEFILESRSVYLSFTEKRLHCNRICKGSSRTRRTIIQNDRRDCLQASVIWVQEYNLTCMKLSAWFEAVQAAHTTRKETVYIQNKQISHCKITNNWS